MEARLEFAGGQRVRLNSSSNTVGMIPWHAEVDSKISVQFSPQTAVDLLHLLHVAAPETMLGDVRYHDARRESR